MLLQLPLQRAPVHLQPPRRLGDVAAAIGEDAVEILPFLPIERGHVVHRRGAPAPPRPPPLLPAGPPVLGVCGAPPGRPPRRGRGVRCRAAAPLSGPWEG